MACLLTTGRTEPCKNSVGGLKKVFFMDYGTLGDITYSDATKQGEIDTISGTPTAFEYDLKGNSNLEQTITSSRENGTTFYDQILTLTF